MSTIKLHAAQSDVIQYLFNDIKPGDPEWKLRMAVFCGSRGLGKSWLAGAAATLATGELEQLDQSVPNKNIAILCGSHTQVKDVYWPLLTYQFGLESWCVKGTSQDRGRLVFPNRTSITCWSSESYDRLRGSGQYLVIADEFPTWSVPGGSLQDAWESVLEPCIVTRWSAKQAEQFGAPSPGRALIPSTPMGKDYFYEMFQREVTDDRWKSFQYTYRDAPHLSVEDIEKAKLNADPIRFAREYEASFEDSGANVFYAFDRRRNVKVLEQPTEDETIHCAIDFNILINATSFHVIRGKEIHCIGEHQGSANTEELAEYIRKRFPKNRIVCFPDPSGKRRVTSAPIGQTDFSILREAGFQIMVRNAAPPIVDSVAAVNRKFLNAAGDVTFFIDPSCQKLIDSLEKTVWLENRPETATIDKSMNIEHFSDGIRYMVEFLFPITRSKPRVNTGFSF